MFFSYRPPGTSFPKLNALYTAHARQLTADGKNMKRQAVVVPPVLAYSIRKLKLSTAGQQNLPRPILGLSTRSAFTKTHHVNRKCLSGDSSYQYFEYNIFVHKNMLVLRTELCSVFMYK